MPPVVSRPYPLRPAAPQCPAKAEMWPACGYGAAAPGSAPCVGKLQYEAPFSVGNEPTALNDFTSFEPHRTWSQPTDARLAEGPSTNPVAAAQLLPNLAGVEPQQSIKPEPWASVELHDPPGYNTLPPLP